MKKLIAKIGRVLVLRVQRDEYGNFPLPGWYSFVRYGVDHSTNTDYAILMPVPLNIVAAAAYGIYQWARYIGSSISYNPRVAYAEGRADGMRGRITDEDIKTYLLRKKIAEANGEPNYGGTASMSIRNRISDSMNCVPAMRAPERKSRFGTSTN